MMKKQYMTPTFEVVEINTKVQLLAGSDPLQDIMNLNGEDINNGWADSREMNDVWNLLMN